MPELSSLGTSRSEPVRADRVASWQALPTHGHRALSVVGTGAKVGVAGLRWPEGEEGCPVAVQHNS